ncbi:hypothetical protein [Neorhizobium alkalisoli]|uniref:Uncharacterized protein n=1 Tax=Neorhizobium alkalisoli TaxID=528178 RepID=A0A561QUY6_9HYPH|nr:hypothetical protein [Neorhizobium alkalisoli]TWF54155.1 hypothetical protein FHW37_10315 [Neorhizobium alkalisoli]
MAYDASQVFSGILFLESWQGILSQAFGYATKVLHHEIDVHDIIL